MTVRLIIASLTFVLSLILGIYVLIKSRKSYLKIVFFLLTLSIALWSISSMIAYTTDTLSQFIPLFKSSSIFATLNVTLTLHFVILLVEPNKHQKWWIVVLLYIPAVVFIIIALFENNYFSEFHKDGLLWQYKHQYDSVLFMSYVGLWVLYNMLSLFLLLRAYIRARSPKIKRERFILFIALMVYVILGLMKALVLPLFFDMTSQGGILALQLIWLASVAILMENYRFMFEPIEAERLALMEISGFNMIICDCQHKIITINHETEDILDIKQKDLIARNIHIIIPEWDNIAEELPRLKEEGLNAVSCKSHFVDRENQIVKMDCKISLLQDKWNEVMGYLIIAKESDNQSRFIKKYELTNRELEVITLVINGYSNKQIAQQLFITERTVKAHLTNIFNKVQVGNRFQLISKMKKYNMISDQESDKDLLLL